MPLNLEQARLVAARFLGELPASLLEQTGGLSGARVWRVESSRGTFALRQNPTEFPTEARLKWLHRILKEVRDRGCALLPCPVATSEGATWIKHETQLWELLTWIPGEPLLETSASGELLAAAANALAELHRVLQAIPFPALPEFQLAKRRVPGLLERREMLLQWLAGEAQQLSAAFAKKTYPAITYPAITYPAIMYPAIMEQLFTAQREALRKHGDSLQAQLERAVHLSVPIFPVLRDARPAHVIFSGTTGPAFIDVGSLRPDSAAADLARLLQNWRYRQPDWHAAALAAYNQQRPLSPEELVVLQAYDSSARLLTGVQWLRWLILEAREFSPGMLQLQLPGIIQRLNEYSAIG